MLTSAAGHQQDRIMRIKITDAQRAQAKEALNVGVEKAELLVELQIEAARRLMSRSNLPDTPETVIALTQAIAVTWSGLS